MDVGDVHRQGILEDRRANLLVEETTRATIWETAVEDVLVDPATVDPIEIRAAREDPADLGGQGYLVAREDLEVPVALAAPEAVPPEEAPLVAAAAGAAEVAVEAQGHPTHQSSI